MYKLPTWIFAAIAVVLIALGISLRLVGTVNGNYVFGFDQGLDFLAARSIAVDHKLTLIGSEAGAGFAGLPGIFHGPGYRYILAILLFIAGGNPYGAIVFLAILSIAVLWGIFSLCRRVFGIETAWVAVALASVSLPLSAHARMIWAPNFSGLVAIPLLFALWMSQKKHPFFLFLTAFLSAMLYHFEIPMAAPAILGTSLYYVFVLKLRSLKGWVAYTGGVLAGLLPMLLFESRHGWGVLKGILSYTTRTGSSRALPFAPLRELQGDGNALLGTIRESFLFISPWISALFPWFLIISAVGYLYYEKNKEIKLFVTALLFVTAAHFVIFYPYRGPVYSHYMSLLYFVYPILAAYIAVKSLRLPLTRITTFVLALLLVLGVAGRIPKTIAHDIGDYGGTAKIRGKIDALNNVYEHAAGEPFNLLVFTPPVLPHAYDYILRWYAAKRYGYVPGSALSGTVYLLIEPDPEKPWSYNGWLETVIKKGEIVDSWKLPSGFIIEKRIIKGDM